MDLGLEGKAALVTGGSKSSGRAAARSLAAEGVRVTICSRDAGALEQPDRAAGEGGRSKRVGVRKRTRRST
jgi:3-oxoacyl-[acyl-carrier protein] reductase